MNKKILHISTENSFIEGAINVFGNAFGKNNTFIILNDRFKQKKIKNQNVEINYIDYHLFLKKINSENFSNYSHIILHDMNYWNAKMVFHNPKLNYFYLTWGYELYGIDEKVKSNFLKYFYRYLRYGIVENQEKVKRLIKFSIYQMNNIACLNEELKYFKSKKIFNKQANIFKFNYYPQEDRDIAFTNNLKIVVGHCAFSSINHLKIFKRIPIINNLKVICPLTYGDMNYKEKIIKEGITLFGDNFFAIEKQMPLKSYTEILKSSSFFVLSVENQQGFGNVIICLRYGVKVFLSNKSLLFKELKNLGFVIFSFEEEFELTPLSISEKNTNLELVKKNFSLISIINSLKNYLN